VYAGRFQTIALAAPVLGVAMGVAVFCSCGSPQRAPSPTPSVDAGPDASSVDAGPDASSADAAPVELEVTLAVTESQVLAEVTPGQHVCGEPRCVRATEREGTPWIGRDLFPPSAVDARVALTVEGDVIHDLPPDAHYADLADTTLVAGLEPRDAGHTRVLSDLEDDVLAPLLSSLEALESKLAFPPTRTVFLFVDEGETSLATRGRSVHLRWPSWFDAAATGPVALELAPRWAGATDAAGAGLHRYDVLRALLADASAERLLAAFGDLYDAYRGESRPVAESTSGATLAWFCVDVDLRADGAPLLAEPERARERAAAAGVDQRFAFRGRLDFDACLRPAGARLVAIPVPRRSERDLARLVSARRLRTWPPEILAGPGPLRRGDRLVFVRGRPLDDARRLPFALHDVAPRSRFSVAVDREERGRVRRVRAWLVKPRPPGDEAGEVVIFGIEPSEDGLRPRFLRAAQRAP